MVYTVPLYNIIKYIKEVKALSLSRFSSFFKFYTLQDKRG